MSIIREELVLVDRFSASFSRYLDMLSRAASGAANVAAIQGRLNETLERAAGATSEMAAATQTASDGAETARMASDGTDEMAMAARTASDGIDEMAAAAGRASEGADELAAASRRTSDGIDEMAAAARAASDRIDEMAAAARTALKGADELAKAARRASEGTDELAAASRRTSERTDELAEASRRASERTDEMSAAQNRLDEMLKRIVDATEETAEASRRASEDLNRMSEILEQIADATDELAEAAQGASEAQDEMNRSMRQGQSSASGLERSLLGLARAYISLRTVQAAVNLSDTMTETIARLKRMNDGLQTTAELQDLIYQAAQRSRGTYQETADMVAKLGTMAGEAFNSSAELVAFAKQINKQFALAGTSAQGAQAAMLQLTQAMSSGVLRGEELNSVLEQAPTIAQSIARYMGITTGKMRELASQGKITAQVVKNAMFAAAEETNAAFDKIPLTFGQAWTMAGNAAVKSLEPALQRLNDLLNSDFGRTAVNALIALFDLLGSVAVEVIDLLSAGAQLAEGNWALVHRVLAAVAGAASVVGVKMAAAGAKSVAAALKSAAAWGIANWPILLLIGLAAAAAVAAQKMGLTFEDVFSLIGAAAGGLFAFSYNLVATIWNLIATFAEFFANAFDNSATAIANLFRDLFNLIMDFVSNAAAAIDVLLGSNFAGAVRDFQSNINEAIVGKFGENEVKVERMTLLDYDDTMTAWGHGAGKIGRALDNFSIGDVMGSFTVNPIDYSAMLDASGIPSNLDSISKNTADIKRSVSLSDEDIKLLVDMAERRYINNINLTAQTPVITVNGQNTGDFQEDLQWLENSLKKILMEQAASHTDLSYSS